MNQPVNDKERQKKLEPREPLNGEVINIPLEKNDALAPFASPVAAAKKGNVFIGTLNLFVSPAKAAIRPLHHHYHRKYHGKYKHAKKIFLFDLTLVGLAVALVGFSIYFFLMNPIKNYLDFSLSAPEAPILGQTDDYTFQIKNLTERHISNLTIRWEFPETFTIKTTPTGFNSANNILTMAAIEEKAEKKIIFRAKLLGAKNEKQRIIFRTNFKDDKDSSWKEQIGWIEINPQKSVLETTLFAPEKITVGRTIDVKFSYRNLSAENLGQAVIIPVFPKNFLIHSSTQDLENGRWTINLPPNKKGEIIVSGVLTQMPEFAESNFGLRDFLEEGGKQFLQNENVVSFLAEESELRLEYSLPMIESHPFPGEFLNLNLNFYNQSKSDLRDIKIFIDPPTGVKDKIISLDKNNFPALALLKTGAGGKLETTFQIPKDLGSVATDKNFTLKIQPRAIYTIAEEPIINGASWSTASFFRIATVAEMHAEARYFTDEGDQLGRGPLPPRVGQTTKYWINWWLTTAPNPIKNVTLTGRLPVGVNWTNKTNVTEGEPLNYDPITRTVSWRAESIAVTPGNVCPCSGVGFEVAITPATDDISKALPLVVEQNFSATDAYIEGNLSRISQSVNDLTTDLTTDEMAKDKGVVLP